MINNPFAEEGIISCQCCGSGEYLYNEDGNRNDYCGIEQNSVKWSEDGIALNPRLQAEHTTFANQWLRNIAAQQGIL